MPHFHKLPLSRALATLSALAIGGAVTATAYAQQTVNVVSGNESIVTAERPTRTVAIAWPLTHTTIVRAPETSVTDVKTLTATTGTGLYAPNRAPLKPTALMKLPIGAITPKGWLREQLRLDADGLCGRLEDISHFLKYEGNGWVDPKSNDGWEELPYWLRGYGDLGYVLNDPRINADSKRWVEGILASQRPDGWFGPERLKTSLDGGPDMWPHMLILYVLQSYYEHTPDPRVITFMTKYFQFQNTVTPSQFSKSWAGVRWADDMQAIYWLYNRTGDATLLDLAKKIHENSADYMNHIPTLHNVNLAQGIREPAEYFVQAKDTKDLDATEDDYDTIMSTYGQFAGGGFAGDENARPGYHDPRQGFETCGIVEYMNTFEIMTRISADPRWADRCEDITFNSLPAALTPDHKVTHYITSANSVEIDNVTKAHKQFQNDFAMQAFKPGIDDYRCCPHNYGMGWPYYAESLWLATYDNGLCASLYAASDVTAKAGSAATPVTLTETTDYPFRGAIKIAVATPRATTFPLYLRIPDWCQNATLKINGKVVKPSEAAAPSSYLRIEREWKTGDVVTLTLPMAIDVRTWAQNGNSVSVNYGPLTYSLDIKENWKKYAGTAEFPEYDVTAGSPWNYGLMVNTAAPAKSFKVVENFGAIAANPFTPESTPIRLIAQAREIPNWKADRDNVVETLQESPIRSLQPTQPVTLIPMGAARLRITSFPTIGSGADAHDWTAPAAPAVLASASIVHDNLDAPLSADVPANSNDNGTPRFTWWDHKGSTEWLDYDYAGPQTVSGASVYWFDDTGKGECRVPASWRLLYKKGDEWVPVEGASGYGVAKDGFNNVTFTPVMTKALRVEVKLQNGFSGGVMRWKVATAK